MTGTEVFADVAVIGGGPAGLTTARALRRGGVDSVVVLERETDAGGIPRHSDHPGYGARDLRRWLSGPRYARTLVERALESGAEIRTSTMVTNWDGDGLAVTSPQGRTRIQPRAVVLATGARERPRSARLVPGERPPGVLTTGQLQNVVHLHHEYVGTTAVVVGAEAVSWSAVLTLREAGCRTALMTTTYERPEAYAAMTGAGRIALRVPVARRTSVRRIVGRDRVEAVEIRHLDSGATRLVACDTVIFTGDWIPDNELARSRGLAIDPAHLGPVIDDEFRTSRPGVFAVGNVAHPVDTADMAALDGISAAAAVRTYLDDGAWRQAALRLEALPPFRWIAPSLVTHGVHARGEHLRLWSDAHRTAPRIEVRQRGRVVARKRIAWSVSPGRVFRIPASVLDDVDPTGGDVSIALA